MNYLVCYPDYDDDNAPWLQVEGRDVEDAAIIAAELMCEKDDSLYEAFEGGGVTLLVRQSKRKDVRVSVGMVMVPRFSALRLE